jgi:hypothetical protein
MLELAIALESDWRRCASRRAVRSRQQAGREPYAADSPSGTENGLVEDANRNMNAKLSNCAVLQTLDAGRTDGQRAKAVRVSSVERQPRERWGAVPDSRRARVTTHWGVETEGLSWVIQKDSLVDR